MKLSKWIIFLFLVMVWGSCTKDESLETTDGIVKTIDSVRLDTHLRLIQLDDGKYIALCQGKMIKLDATCNVEWKKQVTALSQIRAAAADPGIGFTLFGLPANAQSQTSLYACRYDRDGNFIDGHAVNANGPADYTQIPAFIIPLSNGGYAITTSSMFSNSGLLKILDANFNLLYSRAVLPSADYSVLTIQNVCELPNGDFAISAAVGESKFMGLAYIHPALILTGPNGIIKSTCITGDSVHSAMSYTVTPYHDGFFAVTSDMADWGGSQGSFVDYYGSTCIAGSIRIDKYNTEGQLTDSRNISGYPGFGLIKSVRPVSDGGFILCGTVNNHGSSVTVSKTKIYVCKLDANLNQQWSKVIQTTYQSIGIDAVPEADGGFLVTGNLNSFNTNEQIVMIKMDANGNY